jgi:hypothetical protein
MTTATATASALLADGLAELAAAVDHDLRDRLRTLQREAEAWLAANDPADDWARFEAWLGGRADGEIADNHAMLRRGAARLAADAGVAVDVAIAPPATPVAEALLSPRRPAAAELGLTTLRGSCGGVITAGLLGNLAGMAVAAPLAVVVGLAFGIKSLRDDRARHLAVRRAEAKLVVQRYVDEVVFQCANASRRSLREVQRRFRAAVAPQPTVAAPVIEDGTRALAPISRTLEHPPLVAPDTRSRRGAALLVAAALVGVALVGTLVLREAPAPAHAAHAAPASPVASTDGAAELVAHLVAATRDGRADVLLDRLHPAVIERYGVDACRSYLSAAGVFPLDLTAREATAASRWTWETDGVRADVTDVVLVEVSRVINGETVLQELHLARADGSLGWFTDCGEPLSIQ